MSTEYWWNDSDGRKPKYSEEHLSRCHSVDHKFHKDGSEIQSGRRLTAWDIARPWNPNCTHQYWQNVQLFIYALYA